METALGTRAVERPIQPGQARWCDYELCESQIKFQARHRHKIVLCNVYEDGRWDRLEHFHPKCYAAAGFPYGPVDKRGSNTLPSQRNR